MLDVLLIGFGTFVVILSLSMFISRLSVSITEPSVTAALIPVRLAFDAFENNTLPITLDMAILNVSAK
jgi:hypothetical protein